MTGCSNARSIISRARRSSSGEPPIGLASVVATPVAVKDLADREQVRFVGIVVGVANDAICPTHAPRFRRSLPRPGLSQKVYVLRGSVTADAQRSIVSQKAVSKNSAGRRFGYARVSTDDQTLALQLDALKLGRCSRIFKERASGASRSRPGLDSCLRSLRAGDVLVVWRLDRLGRSLSHLLELIDQLHDRGVGFRSLTESIDTTSAGGKLVFSIFGALAEYERAMIRERVSAGMAAAKRRGIALGRRRALTPTALEQARKLVDAGEPVSHVARSLRCGISTLYRALRKSDDLRVIRSAKNAS